MLYVVSTPIGNLGDLSYRAVEVLRSVDLIACEDTRKTKILTHHYGIHAPLTSYHTYNKESKGKHLLRLLNQGRRIALVSDAGTPGISDPGFALIKTALDQGTEVVSVPGPSAVISALSISGYPTHNFFFQGFLSSKSGPRKKRLKWLAALGETVVIYESPHRIIKTLKDMQEVLGDKRIVIAREVTKKFEEVCRGTVQDFLKAYTGQPPKGEMVLIFA